MIDNNKILEQMKNDLVYNSCSLQRVNKNDSMSLGADASILVNKNFLTYVPYENENNQQIHGNTRNNIAKQFINRYSLNELVNEYQEYSNKMALEEQEHEESFKTMELLANKLKPLFQNYGTIEASHNYITRKAEIKYICKINCADKWNEYSENIKITLEDKIYNIERMIYNRGCSGKIEKYQFNFEQLKKFITNLIEQYKQIEAEEEPKIQAIKEETQRQNKINYIAAIMCTDKEHIYILKNKRSFIAINQNTKWSAGIGKEGRFYKTNCIKISKLIKEKGINEVLILNKNEDMLNIDWNKKQFTNLLEIA